jgi:ATP:corrinoid adenosyltransferase
MFFACRDLYGIEEGRNREGLVAVFPETEGMSSIFAGSGCGQTCGVFGLRLRFAGQWSDMLPES